VIARAQEGKPTLMIGRLALHQESREFSIFGNAGNSGDLFCIC